MKLSLVPNLCSVEIAPIRLGLVESLSVDSGSEDSITADNFEPEDIDGRITIPATIAVVVFALVIILLCTLKKGRSDGFGAPR
jgi:hypothetical protein